MTILLCRHCNKPVSQQSEKALSGEVQTVWADKGGEWVCEITGDEHCPVDKVCGHRAAPLQPGTFVVMEGNPVDGFVIHGIPAFPDYDTADVWAREHCTESAWVMPLQDVD